jgi:hypothetical protein
VNKEIAKIFNSTYVINHLFPFEIISIKTKLYMLTILKMMFKFINFLLLELTMLLD